MKKHITVVAALHIGLSALGLLVGMFLFMLLFGVGLAIRDRVAMPILAITGTTLALFLILLSLPGLLGGIGLLRLRPWGRILVLAVSVFHLLNIPLGTAIAVYTFWAMMQDDTEALFRGEDAPSQVKPEVPRPAPLPSDAES